MHIAIDITAIGPHGTRDDALGFIENLDKKHRFTIFRKKRNRLLRFLWQQLYLPILLRKIRADVLYEMSSFDIFLASCPVVIKVDNMAPFLRYKKKSLRLKILRIITLVSTRTADEVITLSETAKKVLGNHDKIHAIHQGADIKDLRKENLSISLPKRYILAVSHVERYKNYKELITAYSRVENAPPLLIAGAIRDKKYFREIKKCENVYFLGMVPRGQLFELYKRAEFFIFPSLVETCPRTLVEAMKMGLPILCSNISVMPEIAKDSVVYFDPYDPGDIKEKIKLMLKIDKSLLRQRALERGKLFDWDKTVRKTLQVLEKAVMIDSYE